MNRRLTRAQLYSLAARLLAVLPRQIDPAIWWLGGLVAYLGAGKARRHARENQTTVGAFRSGTGISARITAELCTAMAFVYYIRYFVEMLVLPSLTAETIAESVVAYDTCEFLELAREHKPVIAVLAHTGNWDWGGSWVAGNIRTLTAVAEDLDDPGVTQWFLDRRRSQGIEVELLGGNTTSSLLRVLAGGGLVALVMDRDISGTGVEVSMFGRKVLLPAGPGVLAAISGAAVLPVATYHGRGRKQVIRFFPSVRPRGEGPRREQAAELTRELAGRLEEIVAAAPSQWHNFQPYFSREVPS